MKKAYKFDVFALLVIRIMAEIIPAYVKIAKKTTEIWAAASYNGEAQPKKRMKRRNLEQRRVRLRLKEQSFFERLLGGDDTPSWTLSLRV